MSPIGSLILGCAGWGGKSSRGTSKSNCILLTARVTVVCSSDSASKAAVCHHRSHAKATAHTEQSAVSTGQPVAFENFVAEPADGSTSLTLLFKSSSSSLKLPVSSNNSVRLTLLMPHARQLSMKITPRQTIKKNASLLSFLFCVSILVML